MFDSPCIMRWQAVLGSGLTVGAFLVFVNARTTPQVFESDDVVAPSMRGRALSDASDYDYYDYDEDTSPVLASNWLLTLCNASTHVLCPEATSCEPPVNGISRCHCRKRTASTPSIIPSSQAGAPALTGARGDVAMCMDMQEGKLYSAFEPWILPAGKVSMAVDRVRLSQCTPKANFPYCWGAPCIIDTSNPDMAFCDCPVTSTVESRPFHQVQYTVLRDVEECIDTNNVGLFGTCATAALYKRDWMMTLITGYIPEDLIDQMTCV